MKKIKLKDIFSTRMIAVVALLTAMNVVLARFISINVWNIKISFAFVTLMIAAYFFGPVASVLVGGLGDAIGAILFPVGPYFPGFTLTAALIGLCFGYFLKNKPSYLKIVLSVFICEIFGTLIMNTVWIAVLYNVPIKQLFISRLTAEVIPMTIIESIVGILLFGKSMAFDRIKDAFRYKN